MKRLLLFALSQALLPLILGEGLSSELFRAVFDGHQDLEFGEEANNSIFQSETELNPELTQEPLSFVPGKDCHSIMTEDFGEFSLPVYPNNKSTRIWCNWIIWAGPKKHIVVSIKGFVSSEDCAKNQDAILFHGIASTVDSTVIYACWNKNNHVFATQAVALHVVFISRSSSQIHAVEYFNGTYYTFEDNETIPLKYPSLSSVVPKQPGSNHYSSGTKRPTNGQLLSTMAVTTGPMKTSYKRDPKTSLQQSFVSRFAPSFKEVFYSPDPFISKLISITQTQDAHCCTDAEVTPSSVDQTHIEMTTMLTVDKHLGIPVHGPSKSSNIPSRTRLFTTIKMKEKSTAIGDQTLAHEDANSVSQGDSRKGLGKNALRFLSNGFLDSVTQKGISWKIALVSPRLVKLITKSVQQQLFKDHAEDTQTSQNDSNNDFAYFTGYTKSSKAQVSTFSLEHKYGPSIPDGYVSSISLASASITKLIPFLKARRKDKRKNPLFKDKRNNRKRNRKMEAQKNESAPVFLAYRNFNSKVTPQLRIIKEIKPGTATDQHGNVGSQGPLNSPRLRETEAAMGLHLSSSEVGHKVAKAMESTHSISTIMSPNMTTFEAEDPFDTVAISAALANGTVLKFRHNPGDTLFALIMVIEHQRTINEGRNEQDMDLLKSIKEKIKENLSYSSHHLNEIKFKHFQRAAFNAVLTFWIHLKHEGKNFYHFKSQLEMLDGNYFGNRKYVLVSLSVEDVNECESGIDLCDEQADCLNELGTYTCHCKKGYEELFSETLGTTCVRNQQSGVDFFFSHLEILIGTSLGVVMLLIVAVVILCAVLKKKQVKGTLNLGSRVSTPEDPTAQVAIARPALPHASVDCEPVVHRIFPLAQQASAEGHAPDKRFSTNKVTKVTFEQSACL